MSFLEELEDPYYRWIGKTLPKVVRFIRDKDDDEFIEVECIALDLETNSLERQGAIYVIPVVYAVNFLRSIGLRETQTLERSIDAAWNFLHSVYYVDTDRMEIR